MKVDPRDRLWKASFETFYDSFFEEMVADSLINRWQLLDEVTKISVALTATGSAVSGWALWNKPHLKTVWAILAGIGAVLAIFHTTLGVPRRLKDWSEIKQYFASLRIDLETFRYRMEIDPEFPLDKFSQEFVEYRKQYKEGANLLKNDILLTKRLQIKFQDRLNERLQDKIVQ